jgi:uncharacterized protein
MENSKMKSKVYMPIIILTSVLVAFSCATAPEPVLSAEQGANSGDSTVYDFEGIWQGVIKAGGAELRLVFHLSPDGEEGLKATADSPDQGATGIPVKKVTASGGSIQIDVEATAGRYEGEMAADGNTINGVWHQGGGEFAVDLVRIDAVEIVTRPQDPVPPFPYVDREIRFTNPVADISLAGTLTIPAGDEPFPAAVLISGSGAQNRNEEIMNHRPFLVVADYLTRNGIAVLRYDDRGAAESEGDHTTATSKDFAGDAWAAAAYLQSVPEIDSTKIGLIGHSEGGIIAPIIAAEHPEIAYIVLLAAPGFPGNELLIQQSAAILRTAGASEAQIAEAADVNTKTHNIVLYEPDNEKALEKLKKFLEDLGVPASQMDSQLMQVEQLLSPWFRFFLSFDPRTVLELVTCPVLGVWGTLDVQVPSSSNIIEVRAALSGNPDISLHEMEGLNHLFQHAMTGAVAEYATIDETFSPEVLELMASWIMKRAVGGL